MGQSSSQRHRLIKRGDLKPGDHITVNRFVFVYHHHGIYVGDDMVIHLLPLVKQSDSSFQCQKCGHTPGLHGGIVKTCLDCFLDGNSLYIFYHSVDCKPPDEVVKIATEFWQGMKTFADYNFAFNNCEDFASFCKIGTKSSEQRQKVVATAATTLIALGGLVVAKRDRAIDTPQFTHGRWDDINIAIDNPQFSHGRRDCFNMGGKFLL